jgi:hypothetical protein
MSFENLLVFFRALDVKKRFVTANQTLFSIISDSSLIPLMPNILLFAKNNKTKNSWQGKYLDNLFVLLT